MKWLPLCACLLAGCAPASRALRPASEPAAAPPPAPPGFAWKAEPAVIQFELGGTMLAAVSHAPRVKAGTPLEVRLFSYGGGCEAAGGATVHVEASEARIDVWDYTRVPLQGDPRDMICTTALSTFKRTVWVSFAQRGSATIRVSGKRWDGTVGKSIPAEVLSYVVVE